MKRRKDAGFNCPLDLFGVRGATVPTLSGFGGQLRKQKSAQRPAARSTPARPCLWVEDDKVAAFQQYTDTLQFDRVASIS